MKIRFTILMSTCFLAHLCSSQNSAARDLIKNNVLNSIETTAGELNYKDEFKGEEVIAVRTGCMINDDNLKILVQRFPNLKKIESYATEFPLEISDEGVKHLTNLMELYIPKSYVTNAGIQNLTQLRILHIHYSNGINGRGIISLTNLTELYLCHTSDMSFGLKKLTNLTKLEISGCLNMTMNNGLRYLTNLTHLDLCANKIINDQGIRHLTQLRYLQMGDNITLRVLSLLPNLTKLDRALGI